jgi:glycosyltransferase involved in cell wall biosynthesis
VATGATRVLHVTRHHTSTFGGVQTVVEALRRNGSHHVLSPDGLACPPGCAQHHGGAYGGFTVGRNARDLDVAESVRQVRHAAAEIDVAIIHAHNLQIPYEPYLLGQLGAIARDMAIPFVLTAYDVFDDRFTTPEVTRNICIARPDRVVSVSHYTQNMLATSNVPSVMIPGCISDDIIRLLASHTQCDHRADSMTPVVVGLPGRLVPEKGQAEGIRAAACSGANNVILSSEQGASRSYLDALRQLGGSLGVTIEFAASAIDLYTRATLSLVVPRRPESQGLTPLESVCLGKPAVVRLAGGLAEYEGIPGIACVQWATPEAHRDVDGLPPIHDADRIAAASRWVIDNLAEWLKLADAGRAEVVTRFGPRRMVASLDEVYRKLR